MGFGGDSGLGNQVQGSEVTKSILVVDDDERLLKVIALFFEVKGYEVRTANGGAGCDRGYREAASRRRRP